MSMWLDGLRLPDIDDAKCDSPRAFELKQLRAVGLNPEEWLLVRTPRRAPIVILKKRGASSGYLVLSRRAR